MHLVTGTFAADDVGLEHDVPATASRLSIGGGGGGSGKVCIRKWMGVKNSMMSFTHCHSSHVFVVVVVVVVLKRIHLHTQQPQRFYLFSSLCCFCARFQFFCSVLFLLQIVFHSFAFFLLLRFCFNF
jgi:hypothetical protein